MTTLYKAEYKRYMVQLPLDLSAHVEKTAAEESRSGSQIIVELVRRGASAEPAAVMSQLYEDQRTLLVAAQLALTATYGQEPEKSEAAESLVKMVLNSGMRQPRPRTAEPMDSGPPHKEKLQAGAGPRDRVSKSA